MTAKEFATNYNINLEVLLNAAKSKGITLTEETVLGENIMMVLQSLPEIRTIIQNQRVKASYDGNAEAYLNLLQYPESLMASPEVPSNIRAVAQKEKETLDRLFKNIRERKEAFERYSRNPNYSIADQAKARSLRTMYYNLKISRLAGTKSGKKGQILKTYEDLKKFEGQELKSYRRKYAARQERLQKMHDKLITLQRKQFVLVNENLGKYIKFNTLLSTRVYVSNTKKVDALNELNATRGEIKTVSDKLISARGFEKTKLQARLNRLKIKKAYLRGVCFMRGINKYAAKDSISPSEYKRINIPEIVSSKPSANNNPAPTEQANDSLPSSLIAELESVLGHQLSDREKADFNNFSEEDIKKFIKTKTLEKLEVERSELYKEFEDSIKRPLTLAEKKALDNESETKIREMITANKNNAISAKINEENIQRELLMKLEKIIGRGLSVEEITQLKKVNNEELQLIVEVNQQKFADIANQRKLKHAEMVERQRLLTDFALLSGYTLTEEQVKALESEPVERLREIVAGARENLLTEIEKLSGTPLNEEQKNSMGNADLINIITSLKKQTIVEQQDVPENNDASNNSPLPESDLMDKIELLESSIPGITKGLGTQDLEAIKRTQNFTPADIVKINQLIELKTEAFYQVMDLVGKMQSEPLSEAEIQFLLRNGISKADLGIAPSEENDSFTPSI